MTTALQVYNPEAAHVGYLWQNNWQLFSVYTIVADINNGSLLTTVTDP